MTHDPYLALLDDPTTPAVELARVAAERPDLRVRVAGHPAAYPELLGWLAAQGDPAVAAAVAARRAGAVPAAPPAPAAPATATVQQAAQPYIQPASYPQDVAPTSVQSGATYAQPLSSDPGVVWTGDDPTGTVEYAPVGEQPRRRRTGLWVGVAAAAVVVVGAGGYAAWANVLSKLGGAGSPQAAVTQLVDGLADRDGVAIVGVLAPSEVQPFRDASQRVGDLASSAASDQTSVDLDALREALDALDVKVSDLDLEVEQIDDGLAKVSLTDGTLTVDGDAEKITGLVLDAMAPVLQSVGQGELSDDDRADAVQQLDDALPWSVDASQLTFETDAGTQEPFLMAVEEDGHWYVSPLMTIGEYITVAQGGTRGAMPDPDAATYSSPQAAGTAFVEALPDVVGGDLSALTDVLSVAERRFMSVYVEAWADGFTGSDVSLTVDSATFTSTSLDDTHALLVPDDVSLTADGSTLSLEGTCASVDGSTSCIEDVPGLTALGLGDSGLVAVKEGGTWRVSVLGTFAHVYGVVVEKALELQKDGKLEDPQWLQDNFGDLASGFGGLGGLGGLDSLGGLATGGGLDDVLGGYGDGSDEWLDEDGSLDLGDEWSDEDWSDEDSSDEDWSDWSDDATQDWGIAQWSAQSDLYAVGIGLQLHYLSSDEALTADAVSIEDGQYVLTTSSGSEELGSVSEGVVDLRFVPGSGGDDFCVEAELAVGGAMSFTPQGSVVEGACAG